MGMGRMSHSYVRNQWEEKIESQEKQNHEHHHEVVPQPLRLKKGCHPSASDGKSTERVDPTVDDPVVVSTTFVNTVVDLLYGYLDPRIHYNE